MNFTARYPLGTVSAAMILAGVFSPLDLILIDTVNLAGYVLWSVWLTWLAIAVVRDSRTFVTLLTAPPAVLNPAVK